MDITETVYVKTRKAWRAWLKTHHTSKREIWLIYRKKTSGKPRLEYGHAVEEALCFGWIDSTVKTIDAERYAQRFTPRKKGSNWSTPNLFRVDRLAAEGLMTQAGAVHLPSKTEAKAFHAKHIIRTTGTTEAPKDLVAALKKNKKANDFWSELAPGYRRTHIRMINDAKQAETRARRIAKVVGHLAKGEKAWLG